MLHEPNPKWTEILTPTETGLAVPLEYVVEVRFEVRPPSLPRLKKLITYSGGTIPDDDYMPLWREFTRDTIQTEIALIVLSMDLSFPGSSFRGKYLFSTPDRSQVNDVGYAYLEGPFEFALEQGFDPPLTIDFEQVWSYLKNVNGLRDGTPDTPAGKVLCALTYLYADTGPSARFFKTVWACYGLEGFYAEGSGGRGIQVSERMSLFLGLDERIVSRLTKLLYESRSKFIHGNKALSSALVEVSPPEGKTTLDEWDAEFAGAYFLAETARRCIQRKINKQAFSLSMVD